VCGLRPRSLVLVLAGHCWYIKERERAIAGASCRQFRTILNFIANFILEKCWVHRDFKKEGWLSADKGIERLMLAV